MKRRLCRDCVKNWKRRLSSRERKALRAEMKRAGRKMREFYPAFVWHDEVTRRCARHHVAILALGARRRAAKMDATPEWADKDAIRAVYAEANRIQRETGQKMHVDHIVPLQGRAVRGLHVANNLQVLPARENVRKSNKWPVAC